MLFSNICLFTREAIEQTTGYLVKVPVPSSALKERNKYFYISDIGFLKHVAHCPLTRRIGTYYAVKLSQLNHEQFKMLHDGVENELIEESNALDRLAQDFPWEKKRFGVDPHDTATSNFDGLNKPAIWALAVAFGTAYLALLGEDISDFVTNSETLPEEIEYDVILISMLSSACGMMEYFFRKANQNRYGLFSYPFQCLSDALQGEHSPSFSPSPFRRA